MVNQYKKHAADSHWSYSWALGDNPVVSFCNSKVKTNVIYTLDELQSVLKRSDEENSFIPLPRRIMENALSIVDGSLTRAA
ncbi:MAG: hypothetical protein COB14_08595 [Alphaproteobacteria bacterium]|nr:MAG: hypothetical protein COB14_08595 [Alphaproteobacteria bacterium]